MPRRGSAKRRAAAGQREERESHRFSRWRNGWEKNLAGEGVMVPSFLLPSRGPWFCGALDICGEPDAGPASGRFHSFTFWRMTLRLMRMQFRGRRQSQNRHPIAKTWTIHSAH